MYIEHYGLTEKPFQNNTDPKFLWLGEKHKEALAVLKHGISEDKGFLLLTGDVGTGKTTLINALLNSLDENVLVAVISDPGLDRNDFLDFIGRKFRIKEGFKGKGDFLAHFESFLNTAYKNQKKVLLIIDESQRLNAELLEEVRVLSNIEKPHAKLINIFIVGQNEVSGVLVKPENRAFRQRITINYNIKPLRPAEIGEYIQHRLKVAGSSRSIFSPKAIREIFAFSGGYPRLINTICDRALLSGFVKGKDNIDRDVIKECSQELNISYKLLLIEDYYEQKEDKSAPKPWRRSFKRLALAAIFLILCGYFFLAGGVDFIRNAAKTYWGQTNVDVGNVKIVKEISAAKNQNYETVVKRSPVKVPPKEQPQKAASVQLPPLPDLNKIHIVYFGNNSNQLSQEALKRLQKIAGIMLQHPELKMLVRGYTDNTGSYKYNKKLSEFRSQVVKSYFVEKGVSASKIDAAGMGPVVASNDHSGRDGNKSNRRIEIKLQLNKPVS